MSDQERIHQLEADLASLCELVERQACRIAERPAGSLAGVPGAAVFAGRPLPVTWGF
jgi:hypothetical protein